ncbi:MAG: 4Fe-4S binding protein, partial [Sulfuricella sp.]|nr:4Fe-4S binding protein [Sulfuricella sp.]
MKMEQPLFFHQAIQPIPSSLQRLGDAMKRYRCLIISVQWAVVVFYLALVTIPAFLPLPGTGSSLLNNLTLLAQFMFWGIWWPFVIVSTLALGRVWCGVFCPEGTLTELASRYGLGRPVPRWLKWGGWPFTAFVITTVYGQ